MAAKETKPQPKNTIAEGIDTQQWTANLKNEILKSHNITPENAGRLAEQIVTQYKSYRAAGNNHEQALGATQKEMAQSYEKMHNEHQAGKSLSAYEVGLQPAAFPLAAVPIMAPALMVEIGAFMTAIAVSCKLTEDNGKGATKSNSPYVNAPPYTMDAAPSGPGTDFRDKGFDAHSPEPQIHSTPVAETLPTLKGYEGAPQEYLSGIPEGFTKVDLPDTFILHLDETESGRQYGTHRELKSMELKDSHHIIQHAAAKELPGYNFWDAPTVQLDGPSNIIGSEHYNATKIQRESGGGTYASERRIGYKALRKAGVNEFESRAIIAHADNYFSSLGVINSTTTLIPGNRKGSKNDTK